MDYCKLCGNERTLAEDRIGDKCRELIAGPLALPYAFWKECSDQNRRCCGSIDSDKDGLYFHGKGWECSYPPQPKDGEPSVGVEMGITFGATSASTYYLRDFGSYCDSEEFGEAIPYPVSVSDEAFWEKLDKQLDQAAEAAWNDDILTCEHCGFHYVASNEPCGCDEDEDRTIDDAEENPRWEPLR